MDFDSMNMDLYQYFNNDILEDFEYQQELENHLNDLENVFITVQSKNSENQSKINNLTKIHDNVKKEDLNEITNEIKNKVSKEVTNEIKNEVANEFTNKNKINDKVENKNNENNKQPLKKYIKYKPDSNDIKYLNTLDTNTYLAGEYNINNEFKIKNDVNPQMFNILLNKKIQLKNTNQITQSTISYYKIDDPTENINDNQTLEDHSKFLTVSDKKDVDFVAEINHILNPTSTYLNYQYSKAELIYKNPNLIDCLHKYLQQTGDHTTSEITDLCACFGETLAMFVKLQKIHSLYIKTKSKYKNENNLWIDNKLNHKFNIIKLPKYLINIINHINYYFKDIKDELKLNEKTGFYNIIYENNEYPLMCKHIYLTLIGKSQYEISTLCCVNSQCKYCGDSMVDYYYDDEDDIPSSIANLVYKLIDLTNSSDDDGVFRTIFIKCTGVVTKFVNKNDKNYDDKASAIVSIYIYKILREAIKQNKIMESSKQVNSLIKLITDYCIAVEWDDQKIESLLNNDNLFSDISNVFEILFQPEKKEIIDDNMETIFEKYSDSELKTLKQKNELFQFNNTLLDLILDDVDFKFIFNLIQAIEVLSTVINETETIFNNENYTQELFEKLIKTYCPENFIHNWTNNKCEYCGVHSDFKKVDKIYEEYKNKFNSNFVLSSANKLTKFKTVEIHKDDIIKKINSVKENEIRDYIIKRLNISENEYNTINQRMFEVVPYMQSYILNKLSLPKNILNDFSKEEILRLYIFIDKNCADDSTLNMFEIFKYCLLKPTFYFKKKTIDSFYEDEDE